MPISVYKKRGETPLECLHRLRQEKPELLIETLSYAGRLDPMAEGLMIVLVGKEENKKREKFLGLDKVYEIEILFGISTDTGDILGRITNYELGIKNLDKERFQNVLRKMEGKQIQHYPIFSSKTVLGKPLFEWARENRLDEIEIPAREIEIYKIKEMGWKHVSKEKVLENIIENVLKIKGDFRQKEIIKKWQEIVGNFKNNFEFPVIKLRVHCSSGTYMRILASLIGEGITCPALAYSIKRIQIGNFK